MDVKPPCSHQFFPVVITLQGLQSSGTPERSTCTVIGEGLVKDLEISFCKSLHMQDSEESECTSGENNTSVTKDVLCEDLKTLEPRSSQKCLTKSATFPSIKKLYCDSSEESTQLCRPRTCSLPTPVKLMSAIKGTREKQGLSLQKRTVTWAPDVYDPIPTITSLAVGRDKKQQRSKNKKNGKNKHKGDNKQKGSNSSRGSSGNIRRQLRKVVGRPVCYTILDGPEKLVSIDYADGLDNFDVGKPDSNCGSSFFKNSPTNVHYSTAQAL